MLRRRARVASVPQSYASPLLKKSAVVGSPPGSRRVLGGRGLTPESLCLPPLWAGGWSGGNPLVGLKTLREFVV